MSTSATRVAALYDIHGNLPALEAVLRDVRASGVTHVVVGGDVVPGPMPREALQCLLDLELPVQCIRGNGDRIVLAATAGDVPAEVPEAYRPIIRWNAEQLDASQTRALSGWPSTTQLNVRGVGDVFFCHATPRNDTEIFTRMTAAERLRPVFQGIAADVVVCGHTHMQFDRTIDRLRVVNAGSVGMPFAGPGAYWLMLGPDVELRRTSYDLVAASERIRKTSYPQANEFASGNVLQPPSEAHILQAYSKAEL